MAKGKHWILWTLLQFHSKAVFHSSMMVEQPEKEYWVGTCQELPPLLWDTIALLQDQCCMDYTLVLKTDELLPRNSHYSNLDKLTPMEEQGSIVTNLMSCVLIIHFPE
ncbi:hypothetical protein V8G54_019458 [Vigna mungo]|uniref:Uncharacterized protein n=1 Tax=Vigna mungo TaxID=3915 RepID=A0AAQ3NBN6_VIGMU